MRIPSNNEDRENLYLDVMNKCLVSREERKGDYTTLRSYYLFGTSPEQPPAYFNKIHPHLDQLTSFLYSAETTRFSINLGASVPIIEQDKTPVLTKALNDEWLNSNADQVFSMALQWALVYNTTYIKLVVNKGIHPYMIEPASIGVLREDIPYTDRQEAIVQTYYITKSELAARLYSHPKRQQIMDRVTTGIKISDNDMPEAVNRIVMSQTNPTIYGNINMDLYGMNRYIPRIAEDTVEMKEMWLWNDDTQDYQVVTMASPDIVVYDRPGASMFLKGECPFVQICPNPQYDYLWGQSECQRLILLQELRNTRMTEILDLLSKQVSPPTVYSGVSGIVDEKFMALNRAGTFIASDMPGAKVDRLSPDMPSNLFEVIHEVDSMFAEASGISNVLSGKGESGVRSQGHASQLARLGSSRIKKRALIIEDSLEKVATLYLKLMQVYDDTHFVDTNGKKFIAEQFTKDFTVKVDAHSNSPIFTEDLKQLAFNLFKTGSIDKESLLDLVEPPMKQLLIEKLQKREKEQASKPPEQHPEPKKSKKEEPVG
jgi:hypothetical protein